MELVSNMKCSYTIGCCGIDCGLCPRFHTNGVSTCPGCCGTNFTNKHPSCGFVTCCVHKKGLETCAECGEFPCPRFDKEASGYDSFVTHRKVFPNLESIRSNGMDSFLDVQKIRMDLLSHLLKNFDDGRSKSFYCLTCALFPIDMINECRRYIDLIDDSIDTREKCRNLKAYLLQMALNRGIELKLNHK